MNIVVYVEGPSDRDGMGVLLRALIEQAKDKGCRVTFSHLKKTGKSALMTQVVLKAVSILRNQRDAHVFAVPDLYPPNVGHPHSTCDELKLALGKAFEQECRRLNVDPQPLAGRFHVHCFKHDFEALLLACEDQLRSHLKLRGLRAQVKWTKPVEDQDFHRPPKRVVEDLFREAGQSYVDTYHAPLILAGADPGQLTERCPQCFKPFLQDLSGLAGVNACA